MIQLPFWSSASLSRLIGICPKNMAQRPFLLPTTGVWSELVLRLTFTMCSMNNTRLNSQRGGSFDNIQSKQIENQPRSLVEFLCSGWNLKVCSPLTGFGKGWMAILQMILMWLLFIVVNFRCKKKKRVFSLIQHQSSNQAYALPLLFCQTLQFAQKTWGNYYAKTFRWARHLSDPGCLVVNIQTAVASGFCP